MRFHLVKFFNVSGGRALFFKVQQNFYFTQFIISRFELRAQMEEKDIIYVAEYLITRKKEMDLVLLLKTNCTVMKF